MWVEKNPFMNYDFIGTKIHSRREEFIIPNKDFITTFLNVTSEDIKKCEIYTSGDITYYNISLVRKPLLCPYCNQMMIGHGTKLRTINHPKIRGSKGIILYHANRYICKSCGKTALEQSPFSFEKYGESFFALETVMDKLSNLNYTLKMISDELNISTTQISKYLDSYVTIPPRALPESLGIDEVHSKSLSRRNTSYICVLVDNEKRTVYDVLDTRSKNALSLYFSGFTREERLSVRYVTIDMWRPYKDVVETYLPNAIIAVDPFHVVKHLTDDFTKIRIYHMNNTLYGSNTYYLLKQWNWLLTSENVYLDNKRVYNRRFGTYLNRGDLLNMILESFPDLAQAYDLKEEYMWLDKTITYDNAEEHLSKYIQKLTAAHIPQYEEFLSILRTWKKEILNSFMRPYDDRRLSNALAENINGRIGNYITISKGLTNFNRFRTRIIYALNPDIKYALSSKLNSKRNLGHTSTRKPYNKENN